MIYKQTGLNTNKLTVVENKYRTALENLVNPDTPILDETVDLEWFKSKKSLNFLSGAVFQSEDGSYIRRGDNIAYRDLIIIDIEDTGLNSQEVQDIIQEKLAIYKYLLYSTISHRQNNPRLRLVLEPNRDIVKDEYKPTIQHVIQLLNTKYDTSSCTWSQLQGLPIAVRDNEFIFIKHLDGLPYPVQEAVKEEKKVINSVDDFYKKILKIVGGKM